jgi:hypothetical protein
LKRKVEDNQLKNLKFRIKLFAIIFVLVLLFGTVGFSILENIPLIESFYFTIITISTVGYGDIHPVTNGGRLLAIFVIILGVGAFLGAIANSLEMMLNIREKKQRNEKINMIIGIFFDEIGTELISYFSKFDPNIDKIRKQLAVNKNYSDQGFALIKKRLKNYSYNIAIDKSILISLRNFLMEKRGFLLQLLENPNILEHESFSELLMAVFHLEKELELRKRTNQLPEEDLDHLNKDIERVYVLLINQWLDYMRHLKKEYPYLFSLAIRINPFDSDASPIVHKY